MNEKWPELIIIMMMMMIEYITDLLIKDAREGVKEAKTFIFMFLCM